MRKGREGLTSLWEDTEELFLGGDGVGPRVLHLLPAQH